MNIDKTPGRRTRPPGGEHVTDELPRLLTGELHRDGVLEAAEHLRLCVDCQHELVSAAVAHSSLASARRFAPEIVTGAFTGSLAESGFSGGTEPNGPNGPDGGEEPLRLLKPITSDTPAEIAADMLHPLSEPRHASSKDMAAAPTEFALPDLSSVFAQVRAEAAAAGDQPKVGDRAPQRRTRILVAAAAAAVVVGGGVAVYAGTSGGSQQQAGGREVQLSAYDVGDTSATARISGSTMTLNATSLPTLAGERYEVWLTNGRSRLVPIGWIGADGKASLPVPANLIAQYSYVQVSVQDVSSDDYSFSGKSVLRGSLT